MTEKEEKIYKCRYCGREFKSNVGRWKHEKKCPQRPKEEEEAEEEQEEFVDGEDEDGITLFDEEDEDEEDFDIDDDEDEDYIYECPECGHMDTEPFDICPECGEELEWD